MNYTNCTYHGFSNYHFFIADLLFPLTLAIIFFGIISIFKKYLIIFWWYYVTVWQPCTGKKREFHNHTREISRFTNKIKPQPVRAREEIVVEGVGNARKYSFWPPSSLPVPTFPIYSPKIELFVIADKLIMQLIIYLFTLGIFNKRPVIKLPMLMNSPHGDYWVHIGRQWRETPIHRVMEIIISYKSRIWNEEKK